MATRRNIASALPNVLNASQQYTRAQQHYWRNDRAQFAGISARFPRITQKPTTAAVATAGRLALVEDLRDINGKRSAGMPKHIRKRVHVWPKIVAYDIMGV